MELIFEQDLNKQSKRMQELIRCFVYQELSEIPCEISLTEYLWLNKIIEGERK